MKKYLFILLALVLFAFTSCQKFAGDPISQVFSIDGTYTELRVEDSFDVFVSDTATLVTVTAGENVMPNVVVEINDNTLEIYLKGWHSSRGEDMIVILPYNADLNTVVLSGTSTFESDYGLSSENIQVELSGASEFHGKVDTYRVNIKLSGASDYFGDMQATEVSMDLDGSSTIQGNVYASDLSLVMSGASDATLGGHVTKLDMDLSGASTIVKTVVDGYYGFACYQCTGKMSGASKAYIHCNDNITVDLSGGSDLHFTGNAFTGDCTTSGGSHIIHDENP